MAKFRNVSVKFWSDPFIESLTPEKKYFFLYLITNEHSSQCGIYEISFRQMAFETGYNQETIEKLIQFFESERKIKYSKKTNEIAIRNFVKHNPQGSPKVASFVQKELKQVKDRLLIPYIYATDTLSQQEQEEEQTQTEEQKENRTLDWFKNQIDSIFMESMKMNHKGKDIEQAIKDSYAHMAADPHRLARAEPSDCKKLLNTWLTNIKTNGNRNGFKGGVSETVPTFSGDYSSKL